MTKTQQNYLGCLVLLMLGISVGPFFDEDAKNESRLAELRTELASAQYPVRIGKRSEMTGANITDDKVLVTHYVDAGDTGGGLYRRRESADRGERRGRRL